MITKKLKRAKRAKRQTRAVAPKQIYRGELRIVLPITNAGAAATEFTLKAVSKGCADIGVCYAPQETTARLSPAALM